jgi:arylsulfatase A-like enzyme
MMRSLDDGIGKVLTALKESGKERDTLVVFCSDNGGERFSQMAPFSHGKMTLYEGGVRVPAFARWPGVIAPDTRTDQVSITMDWTATLLARAGATAEPTAPLDGIDLLPALTGAAPQPRDLYWRTFQRSKFKAMRSGDWKYLATRDDKFLFDLKQDPGEKTDLKSQNPQVLSRLEAKYASWEQSVLPPIPLSTTK